MLTNDSPVVPISAIEHWEYCPRQCALIHVDGVWTDNRFTVKGARFHRRADAGQSRSERGRMVLRSVPLWSEGVGLSGRADVVEFAADNFVPVEYKSGTRHGRAADLQLCAQAICLEEMLGVSVPVGAIWFGGTRKKVTVELDDSLRSRMLRVVVDIRDAMVSGVLPPPLQDERCANCQLAHHCLPDITSARGAVDEYLRHEVFSCDT